MLHPSIEAGQHLDDPHKERARLPAGGNGSERSAEQHIHDGRALGGATAGDRVEARLVRRRETTGTGLCHVLVAVNVPVRCRPSP